MNKKLEDKRQIEFDAIRALAIIGIVGIHVISSLCNTNDIKMPLYIPVTFFEIACRTCLPIFFLLSGALLLTKEITNIKVFYKKRFLKIAPLFMLATFTFTIIHNVHNPMQIIPIYFTGLVNANIFSTFWFVYVICALYLITPFISKMLINLTESEKKFLMILILLLNFATTFFNDYDGIRYITSNFVFIDYIGIYLLGGLIKSIDFKVNSIYSTIIYILSALSFLITILIKRLDIIPNIYDNTIFMVLISSAILIWFKNNGVKINNLLENHNLLKQFIVQASKLSYGIYLFHPILLSILLKATSKLYMPLLLSIVINISLTFLLSLIFMQILTFIKKVITKMKF